MSASQPYCSSGAINTPRGIPGVGVLVVERQTQMCCRDQLRKLLCKRPLSYLLDASICCSMSGVHITITIGQYIISMLPFLLLVPSSFAVDV